VTLGSRRLAANRGHLGSASRGAEGRPRSSRRSGTAPTRRQLRCAIVLRVAKTVLIVDDHPAFRSAARALLEAAGFEVIGESADGASALEAVNVLRPEIVLLDVQLPDLDGFTVAERLSNHSARPSIVLTSSRSVASLRWRLDSQPTWSFIPKNELSGEGLAAIVG
jgi:CheY-like chemotaxis protein